jgi:hypothetical protein
MLVLDCACRIINAYQEDVLGNVASGHTTSRIDSIHGSFPLASSCATVYGDVSSGKLNTGYRPTSCSSIPSDMNELVEERFELPGLGISPLDDFVTEILQCPSNAVHRASNRRGR